MSSPSDEHSQSAEFTLGADEVAQHRVYIEKASQSVKEEDRRQALIEGLVRFGFRFVRSLHYVADLSGKQGPWEKLWEEAEELLLLWLTGKRLTARLDEDERRAQLATLLLRPEYAGAERLAACCLLALPEGHPQRDTALAHAALLRLLERARAKNDADDHINAITALVEHRLEPHERTVELISEGRALAGRGPVEANLCHNFRAQAIGYYVELAIVARDDGRTEARREWAGKAHEIFEEILAQEPDFIKTPAGLNMAALLSDLSEQSAEAATIFASAVDMAAPSDATYELGAIIEARYRMKMGDYERVIKILTPLIPMLEEKYLTAIEDSAVAEAGKNFSEMTCSLAFAHAHQNCWDKAVECLERCKSLRLRYRAALRRSPAGQRLLELEAKLYALSRGVPLEVGEFDTQQTEDWLGAKVSLRNKVLEAYRTQRPRLSPELLAAPSVTDIALALGSDEAVVILGIAGRAGTLIAVVCRGDQQQPSGRFLLKEWPFKRWVPIFAGEREDGWLYALGEPERQLDYRPILLHLLARADEVIGQTLQPFLRERKVRRVTVIPHLWFHLVPFWALPSMEHYNIRMAASAAHFIQFGRTSEKAGHRALVVADPTQDLPASTAEADMVARHLARLHFDVKRLDGRQATEDAVVEALSGVSVFHFCGHGRSDVKNPERSALLLSPSAVDATDPFAHYADTAQNWRVEGQHSRSALIPGYGLLYEDLTLKGQPLERRIEYGARGSLWGRYQNGRLTRLAEMWTAGDIMTHNPLSDCRLAFLSACEAGSSSIAVEVDEYSGLPAALQLADVTTVVCSLWPVSDALTALYVDLFYRTLVRAPQPVDVARVVHQVGRRLRRMKRERAVTLINRLRRQTGSPRVRFLLEAFAGRIAEGEPYPFSHPYDWAAFYATGTDSIQFTQGDAS